MSAYVRALREQHDARWKAAVAGWKKIVEKYQLIADPKIGNGFGAGWLPIIEEAVAEMIEADWDRKIVQVKSKICRLVIYLGGETNPKIEEIMRIADEKAGRTCEDCGAPHWLQTPMSGTALCQKCRGTRSRLG